MGKMVKKGALGCII
jgi:hypothetical protein